MVLLRDLRPHAAFSVFLKHWHFNEGGFTWLGGAAGRTVAALVVLATCALLYRAGLAVDEEGGTEDGAGA